MKYLLARCIYRFKYYICEFILQVYITHIATLLKRDS